MNMRCWFKHNKKYTAMKYENIKGCGHRSLCCVPTLHKITVTICRRVCQCCGKMGQGILAGTWKIHLGKPVPDEKAWSNWEQGG